ncbi:hypothetical protein COO60DRAFT_1580224 [Scenedesmus sp. NREL 46B-D3]|nr:hypothetical protein COO60DRAFT_1580224 [Scenedesmus sp. NREL 46B-D3]
MLSSPAASRARRCRLQCTAAAGAGTPVAKNSILVVGGTGTLGRQVVRKALDEGYEVRCIVKPRMNPADFLRDWGATTVQADLTDPTSLPATLVGISAIIDCATARPEESTQKVDWEGKVALIQCAQAMGIKRYMFMSIFNCNKHPEVPLMNIKAATEEFLAATALDYTVLRLCGFHQAVIGNYAVPILEDRKVWGTNDDSRTAYMDTQDIARLTLAALRSDACTRRTLTLAGPSAYTTKEVIEKCEQLSDSRAQVSTVPTWLLKGTRGLLKGADWAKDAADRLAFAEVLAGNEAWTAPMEETYALLGVDPASITSLDDYLQEYFTRIMKKLKQVGATADRTNFYV